MKRGASNAADKRLEIVLRASFGTRVIRLCEVEQGVHKTSLRGICTKLVQAFVGVVDQLDSKAQESACRFSLWTSSLLIICATTPR